MSNKKVKTSSKMFLSEHAPLREITLSTMYRISRIVGASLGPGGRNVIIESELPGIPNKNTKDGVTIFRNLGSENSYEHLIIEQARDAATRTVSEAGDGTTTATVLSEAIVRKLFEFTDKHPKYSPQKAAREISAAVKNDVVPFIRKSAIQIGQENQDLLKKVAQVSANGDAEMADFVIKAFETVGYSDSSHVVIQELTGPDKFEVEVVEGFPIAMGYEESAGKFHQNFINDKGNNMVILEKPKFVLFDGQVTDLVRFYAILDELGKSYVEGRQSDCRDLVLVAHGFSESVLLELSYNMADPGTLNVVPMLTPMTQIVNSRREFLDDLAAFTGAKVFDMNNNLKDAKKEDFGFGMERMEIQRFRCTVLGDPEQMNIEARSTIIQQKIKNAAGAREKELLEERLAMLTSGIAKLKVYGASNGELKERHDRCEDAVCAVRSAVTHGVLPGGCRVLINASLMLYDKYTEGSPVSEVLVPALLEPLTRLLENVGLSQEEADEIYEKLSNDQTLVYNAESHTLGHFEEMHIYDASKAVEEAVKNATSIATVLGTLGGVIAFPRDHELERQEAKEVRDFQNMVERPESYVNEANNRS